MSPVRNSEKSKSSYRNFKSFKLESKISNGMRINPFIFRAYDIRGIYGKDLTEGVFQKIGFVLGKKREKFLVGHDIRKSGKKLALALISGLNTAGAKIFFSGEVPFGLCFFSGQSKKVDKILFVTASHLPSEWNGIKISYGDGTPFSSKEIEMIRNDVLKIEGEKIKFKKPNFQKVNFKNDYFETLFKKFPLLKNNKLKVVIDCGNGAVSLVSSQIFKKFGFETSELFCKPDPAFPNRSPEPTLETTRVLRKRVLKEKADFGVAFDGDGDRAVIIDDKGRYLTGNQIGIIFGKEILSHSKEKRVVKTVSCSMAIEEELRPLGIKIIEVPVGHTFVVSGCKKYKAYLGIEESSHIVIPEYFLFDDAILVPLKIAEIILKKKKKLSEIIDKIKIYPFKEISFKCRDEIKFEVIKTLVREFKKKYKKVNALDGVKVNFNYGWILVRASNTSPILRLYIEAKTKEKLDFLKEKFQKVLRKKIHSLL
jgi:phosphomannomutase